jgi:hypothetical protein
MNPSNCKPLARAVKEEEMEKSTYAKLKIEQYVKLEKKRQNYYLQVLLTMR